MNADGDDGYRYTEWDDPPDSWSPETDNEIDNEEPESSKESST